MIPQAGSWPHAPWLAGYSYEIVPAGNDLYWKLFCYGERINGGMAKDTGDATYCARNAAEQHKRHALIVRPQLPS